LNDADSTHFWYLFKFSSLNVVNLFTKNNNTKGTGSSASNKGSCCVNDEFIFCSIVEVLFSNKDTYFAEEGSMSV
jgi:hypothetical protein